MSSYYYDTVMLDNPMVFYPMDEANQGSGQIINDVSKAPASALNGTYNGTQPVTDALPLVSGGVKGTTLGSSNYLTIPALEAWSKSRETYQFTFECWFLLNGDNQGGIRLLQPTTTSGVVPDNYIGIEDGQIVYKIANATNLRSFSENMIVTHNLIEPNVSHHLVATFDNGTIQIYVDSKLVETMKATYKIDWNFESNGFKVSGPGTGNITIDAIAMYRYVLPDSSIQRHYLLGRSTIGSQEIARRTQGHFFPIDDLDSKGTLDIDWPGDSEYKWPYWDKSHNVEISGGDIGLLDITAPDSVDDNMMFTGGAFQCLPGSKLLSDDQSTFNRGLNLFENASFDVDIDGNSVPDGWTAVNTATSASQALTPDAMSSQNAVLLTLNSATNGQKIGLKHNNRIRVQEIVINDAGNPYGILPVTLPTPEPAGSGNTLAKMSLAVDVRGTLTAQKFQARVFQWNSGGTALADTVIPLTVSSSWVRRMATFDILSGAVELQVQFEVVSDGAVTGQVFIDNAQLELGLSYNPYVDGWFRVSSTANYPRMSRSDVYDSGAYALKLECSDAAATYMGVSSERLPADPDDVIYTRLSSYLPANDANRSIEIQYKWYDSAGAQIGSTSVYSSTPTYGAWKAHWAAEKAPALTSAVQVSVIFKATSGTLAAGKEIYLDNIYINELVEEAAQYLVVEEMNRIASANNGAAGVGFYLDTFHSTITNKEFAIMSFDEEDHGIAVVKKYDAADSKHKIVLRHFYKEDGVPTQYDQTIKELVGGDYAAWHYVLLAWSGDSFSVALDAGAWIIDDYVTSDRFPVQLSYDTELTLGAGVDGNDGLGTAIKNVKVYAEIPVSTDFVTNQTANGNYYLPLASDINICMKGYSEYVYDLTPLYDAVDDAKIEWGPISNNVKLYGRPYSNFNLLTNSQSKAYGLSVHTGGLTYLEKYNNTDGYYADITVVPGGGNRFSFSCYSNMANIEAGKTYTAHAKMKLGYGESDDYVLYIEWWDDSVRLSLDGFYSDINSSEWTTFTYTGEAPEGARRANVLVYRGPSYVTTTNVLVSELGIWEGASTDWSLARVQLTPGGEPSPIKGGYCPSLTTTKYYVRAEHETTNAIYKPASLSYLSMTFLDDVKFKTKSAGHELKPMGSYTVSSKSNPIINQYRRNGIKFTRKPASKNLALNGGALYDVSGWTAYGGLGCYVERSTEEYFSGGSSFKITSKGGNLQVRNRIAGGTNNILRMLNDRGSGGFPFTGGCSIQEVGTPNTGSDSPVIKLTQQGTPPEFYYGTPHAGPTAEQAFGNTGYNFFIKVNRPVNKPVYLYVREFNSSDTEVQLTLVATWSANGEINQWKTLSGSIVTQPTTAKVCIFVDCQSGWGWADNDYFYISDLMMTPGTDKIYSWQPMYNSPTIPQNQVDSGTAYILSAKMRNGNASTASGLVYIQWFAPDGSFISTATGGTVSLDNTWKNVYVTSTAPANASRAELIFAVVGVTLGEYIYVDEIQFEKGFTITAYEDNVPSGMYLELSDQWMRPGRGDDGAFTTIPRQQKIGAIESWIRTDETPTSNLLTVRGDDLTAAYDLGSVTKTANQDAFSEKWTKIDTVGTGYGIRLLCNLSDLTNAAYYIGSIEVYNPGASSVTLDLDWCDMSVSTFIIRPKERTVISTQPTARPTYDSTFRFLDVTLSSSGTLWARRPKVELSSSGGTMGQRRYTVLENKINEDYVSGVYYDVDGITYKNMNNVYVDGAAVTRNGTQKFTQGKWHHVVACPSTYTNDYNFIKNPGFIGSTSWTNASSVTGAVSSIPSPNNKNAYSLQWTSASPPSIYDFKIYTDITGISPYSYYTVQFYAKSPGTKRRQTIYVSWRNSSNSEVSTSFAVAGYETAENWTKYSATFFAPAGIDRGYVYLGLDGGAQNELHYISAPMVSLSPYINPYFDGDSDGATWTGTANNSTSIMSKAWPITNVADVNFYQKWFWNTSFNGEGQMNASHSNITIHEAALTAAQALANYKDTLSRGDTLYKSDNMGVGAITDGTPLLISAPWQHHSGSP